MKLATLLNLVREPFSHEAPFMNLEQKTMSAFLSTMGLIKPGNSSGGNCESASTCAWILPFAFRTPCIFYSLHFYSTPIKINLLLNVRLGYLLR